jgi:hypothetical protein
MTSTSGRFPARMATAPEAEVLARGSWRIPHWEELPMATNGSRGTGPAGPGTLYFADRPKRDVGHMSSDHFVANWAAGDNSFADNPPNAVLSFAEPGDRLPEDAVVVIQDPHLNGDALTYSIKLLDGTVPTATGPCALFIDPFGRPLSPVSAAGMHRRERRRMR